MSKTPPTQSGGQGVLQTSTGNSQDIILKPLPTQEDQVRSAYKQLAGIPAKLPAGNKGVPSEAYWAIAQITSDIMDREQQLKLSRTLAGLNGASVAFPGARESAVRNEMVKLAQKGQKSMQKAQAKPENIAMRGSAEEKSLHEAQKALREKRIALGLAKNDSTDARLSAEIAAVKKANADFQTKKATVKKQ